MRLTSSDDSAESATRTSVLLLASAIGLGVNVLKYDSTRSIT